MEDPIILNGFLITILSAIGTSLVGAIGALWIVLWRVQDKLDAVVNLYHEDSKTNTIALLALTDWIKERRK